MIINTKERETRTHTYTHIYTHTNGPTYQQIIIINNNKVVIIDDWLRPIGGELR